MTAGLPDCMSRVAGNWVYTFEPNWTTGAQSEHHSQRGGNSVRESGLVAQPTAGSRVRISASFVRLG